MNKENAHLYLPLVQALAEGKTIECQNTESTWAKSVEPQFFRPPENYRIKPEPVMVPLGPQDVPPGSAIRQSGGDGWAIITIVGTDGISWPTVPECPYDRLAATMEIKRPGEDWKPCHKPA